MYIYDSHLGGFYVFCHELSIQDLYCEECGDSDWFVGEAEDADEAYNLLCHYLQCTDTDEKENNNSESISKDWFIETRNYARQEANRLFNTNEDMDDELYICYP